MYKHNDICKEAQKLHDTLLNFLQIFEFYLKYEMISFRRCTSYSYEIKRIHRKKEILQTDVHTTR